MSEPVTEPEATAESPDGKRGGNEVWKRMSEKIPLISPMSSATMMRFRKGQRHLSVGEVFSGNVSPPLPF